MSILLNILLSAAGSLTALIVFFFGLAVYDCIYEIREKKRGIRRVGKDVNKNWRM